MTILFAYDGSSGAGAAMATAAKLMRARDAEAVVLSVWEPLLTESLRAARVSGRLAAPANVAEVDGRSEHHARELAEHGVRVASELGFAARPLWTADARSVSDTIVDEADDLDADLVVLGARGLGGVRAFLGSVPIHALQHAHRPLLIVPPTEE